MSDNDNSKVQKLKERYANEFIQNMNVENYIKLNEFCRDHETTCFFNER